MANSSDNIWQATPVLNFKRCVIYFTPMRLPIQVLIYIARFTDKGIEYLMLHRCANVIFWQGVSGGVEDGEIPIETAKRELKEETGLVAELIDPSYRFSFPVDDIWKHLYEWNVTDITAHVFIAIVDRSATITLSPPEHDKFRWCSFDDALDLLYWPEDKEALRVCHERIKTIHSQLH
jgi:dATP pyrophosphohydrolase